MQKQLKTLAVAVAVALSSASAWAQSPPPPAGTQIVDPGVANLGEWDKALCWNQKGRFRDHRGYACEMLHWHKAANSAYREQVLVPPRYDEYKRFEAIKFAVDGYLAFTTYGANVLAKAQKDQGFYYLDASGAVSLPDIYNKALLKVRQDNKLDFEVGRLNPFYDYYQASQIAQGIKNKKALPPVTQQTALQRTFNAFVGFPLPQINPAWQLDVTADTDVDEIEATQRLRANLLNIFLPEIIAEMRVIYEKDVARFNKQQSTGPVVIEKPAAAPDGVPSLDENMQNFAEKVYAYAVEDAKKSLARRKAEAAKDAQVNTYCRKNAAGGVTCVAN